MTTFDALDLAGSRGSIAALLRDHLESGFELRKRLHTWAVQEAADSWANVAYLGDCRRRRGPTSWGEGGYAGAAD